MRQRVNLVEDELHLRNILTAYLQKEGYEVDWVVGGNDGLVAARNKQYDMILLDVMLPERRGNEILEALRGGEDLSPNTKIIILTNFEQDDLSKASIIERVDGYLIKADITPRKLLEVIQEIDDGKKVDLTED